MKKLLGFRLDVLAAIMSVAALCVGTVAFCQPPGRTMAEQLLAPLPGDRALKRENEQLKRDLENLKSRLNEMQKLEQPNTQVAQVDRPYERRPTLERSYRRFEWRRPTCTPSKAQIVWARSLANYKSLSQRYSDVEIVQHFAPNIIRSLEGDVLPEELRPQADTINPPYNAYCQDGKCELPRR